MKSSIIYLALVLLITINTSCGKRITSKEKLIEYINNPENGLQKTNQVGQIKTVLTYKPWQLMALGNKINKKVVEKYDDKLYFILSLSANNKELLRQLPYAQYSEMVQVLAFRMNGFIDLVADNQKPEEPEECIFQQTYGMGFANNLLIVFKKEKLLEADRIRLRIKEFGLNTGNLNYEIKTQDIKVLEEIKPTAIN